jgi:transposase
MEKDTSCLPFWEGFRVADLRDAPDLVVIELEPVANVHPVCGRCGARCEHVHEHVHRRIRDLPMVGKRVLLDVHLRRVACPSCGFRMEAVSWLEPHSRLTRRLGEAIGLWASRMATLHVAELLGLHWSTVRSIDRRQLLARLDALPPVQPRRLVMDEFALHRHHRYATVVLDADSGRVIWVTEGKSRLDIRSFFQWLGVDGCARIEAVAMDMNTSYDLEVRKFCPQARVVYDLYHVVAKYAREVIGRVRVDAANRLRHDKPARRVVKRTYWLLLRNRANLNEAERVRLDEVLSANQALLTVYLLQAELKELWRAPDPWEWRRRWRHWQALAKESEIPALMHFARCLRRYWRGILARVRWPMHTGRLEGINNRIKVIKRMAFGYRDTEMFFLKIQAAFPGHP